MTSASKKASWVQKKQGSGQDFILFLKDTDDPSDEWIIVENAKFGQNGPILNYLSS